MRSDFLQEFHDTLGPRELDLANRHRSRGVELRGLLLERVESIETEEFVEDVDGGGVEFVLEAFALKSFIEILDDKILRVSGRETPEVNE